MNAHRFSKVAASFSLVAVLAGAQVALAQGRGGDAPSAARDHRPPGPPHGGPDRLVIAALHENLGLSDAQRSTIEAALDEARPKPPSAERRAALAKAIRAASIDVAALSATAPSPAEGQAAAAKALATLHATLTPAQRSALVDAVLQKMADGPKGPPMGAPPPHARRGFGPGPLGHMLHGLNLTAAQRTALEEGLAEKRPAPPTEQQLARLRAEHEAMRAARTAKLQSFKAARFDASAFVAPPADAPPPPNFAARMLDDLSVAVTVLDSQQREELARRIEEGPKEHGPRR